VGLLSSAPREDSSRSRSSATERARLVRLRRAPLLLEQPFPELGILVRARPAVVAEILVDREARMAARGHDHARHLLALLEGDDPVEPAVEDPDGEAAQSQRADRIAASADRDDRGETVGPLDRGGPRPEAAHADAGQVEARLVDAKL